MYRSLAAAALSFTLLVAPIEAQGRWSRPSAIEVAAAVAACMTESRVYPLGGGVAAQGTVYESMLSEEGEVFASIVQQLDTGELSLATLPIEAPIRGEGWARERDRYAMACYSMELKRLGA